MGVGQEIPPPISTRISNSDNMDISSFQDLSTSLASLVVNIITTLFEEEKNEERSTSKSDVQSSQA